MQARCAPVGRLSEFADVPPESPASAFRRSPGSFSCVGTWERGTDTKAPDLGLLPVYTGGAVGAGYAADEPHAPAAGEVIAALDLEVPPGLAAARMQRRDEPVFPGRDTQRVRLILVLSVIRPRRPGY